MSKNEIALKLGLSILDALIKAKEHKKDFGQEWIIPFKMPIHSNEPDWQFSVKLRMPTLVERYFDEDMQPYYKTTSMAEYYGWTKS
jgi:hypothetical protein